MWEGIRGQGGEWGEINPPPDVKKVLPPLPKFLFSAVPPFVKYSQKLTNFSPFDEMWKFCAAKAAERKNFPPRSSPLEAEPFSLPEGSLPDGRPHAPLCGRAYF